jgi:membrane-associated phospholipid phosphatase
MPSVQKKWTATAAQILTQLLNSPVVAAVAVTWVMLRLPADEPGRLAGWGYSLLFLTGIPLLSLFFYIPFKATDRRQVLHRQRVAHFAITAVSYAVGLWVIGATHAPRVYQALMASYVAVVLGLVAINTFYKASGHAAGVVGPVSALIYLRGWIAIPLLALLPLVAWARMQLKGHTLGQLVVGGALSAVATLLALAFYHLPAGLLAH